MRNNSFLVVLTLGIVFFAASCSKEGPAGPTGPAGPSLTGNISGHVSLYDQYGGAVLTNLKSVSIYFNGSQTPVSPDSTGYYIFNNLITGVYTMAIYCTGYAATQENGLQLVQGTMNLDIKLSQPADSFITGFTAKADVIGENDSLHISCYDDKRDRSYIVFVGSNSAVSKLPTSYLLSYVRSIPTHVTSVNLLVPKQDLTNAGFASGSTVYFAAYTHACNDGSVYEDFATGKNIYNATNNNPLIASAIVP